MFYARLLGYTRPFRTHKTATKSPKYLEDFFFRGRARRKRCGSAMSEDGDVDVESSEDVPDIGEEATATTTNGELYMGGSHDKRAHHNALERRRRDHIKDSFHGLRDCIPSLVGEKVSRAHILNKATEYIRHMQKGGSNREDDICDLARKNEILEEQMHALDEAQSCGNSFCAEELLQSVSSRVQARQAQEVVMQQLQAKASSKSTRQQAKATPTVNATVSPAQGATNDKSKSVPVTKGKETTPTSGPLSPHPNINLLASNIKSTQSLLNALQKNFNNPNSTLPPNIKSLAARVLASPLVRGAQKTAQASSLPRGIVTATTVPKGSSISSPSSATPLTSKSPSASTGINTGSGQPAESAQLESNLPMEPALGGGNIEKEAGADNNVKETAPPSANSLSRGVGGGAAVSTPLLTSQLLKAHNLLQQQGAAVESGEGGGVLEPLQPPGGITTVQGLNISPELLAQVSSLLNLPAASSLAPSLTNEGTLSSSQDSSNSPQLSSQAMATNPAPSSHHKRPSSARDPLLPPAKKPHIEQ